MNRTPFEISLVTGAHGFVGKHLVRFLLSQGKHVRAMVRSENQRAELALLGCEVVVADLVKPESLQAAVSGVHCIYHIAALFRQAHHADDAFFAVNAEGTRSLLEAACAAKVARFVHCSTVGVLSDVGNEIADETFPYNPGDVYQESKALGEKIALEYFASGRMSGVVIRPAMIWGPGDMRTLKIFRMIERGRFFYVGNGQNCVHFIDVRDLCRALLLGMESSQTNSVYIIAGRQAVSLRDLCTRIAKTLGVRKPWLRVPVKPMQWLGSMCEAICKPLGIEPPLFRRRVDFFTKNRRFSAAKASKELHFIPAGSIDDEIVDIIRSYQAHGLLKNSKKIESPAVQIIRNIDGEIRAWDNQAERTYGWASSEVLGKTTHSLLQTRFPYELEKINAELMDGCIWEGELIHTRRDGSSVKVRSVWELKVDGTSSTYVLERNEMQSDNGNPPVKGLSLLIGTLSDLTLNVSGVLPLEESTWLFASGHVLHL